MSSNVEAAYAISGVVEDLDRLSRLALAVPDTDCGIEATYMLSVSVGS
jgi:hypothetical protein